MIETVPDELVDETRNMNALVKAFTDANPPRFDTAEGLAALRSANGYFPAEDAAPVERRAIPGPGGDIDLYCHVPDEVRGVYLEYHGGGWCIGSAASGDPESARMAETAHVAVVRVEYRLAPEHPYPAGPDDCEAAALWVLEHAAAEFGTSTVAVGGASAGAHLAALTLLRLRDRHGVDCRAAIAAANLVFGAYDLGMTPSQRASDDLLVIPRATIEACYENFLPGWDPDARRSPEVSPLYADLAGMPPALFTVGTLDPLLDDSLFMAARWQAAGNEAELAVYPESIHGFPAFPTGMARLARERMVDFVARAVAT